MVLTGRRKGGVYVCTIRPTFYWLLDSLMEGDGNLARE